MMIPLKNYDLAAAKQRMHDLIAQEKGFERGLAFGTQGYDPTDTEMIRTLTGCPEALHHIASCVTRALTSLPHTDGGTARPVGPTGSWTATVEDIRFDLPLVRAMLVLRGHRAFGRFEHVDFRRADQPGAGAHVGADGKVEPMIHSEPGGRFDAAPMFERLFVEHPQTWSYEVFQTLVFEAACRAFGNEEIVSSWLPADIYPGSRIGTYSSILHYLMLYDAFGALDVSFTRQNALVGEWWLIQPVSPRLRMASLVRQFGLRYAGYLPKGALDAPGRVVLACFEEAGWDDKRRIGMLDDSKWVAGYQKVLWSKERPPLSEPSFDLVNEYDPETGHLLGVTEDAYGPFTHSSELPPWPGQ